MTGNDERDMLRTIASLYYMDDLSQQEIAERLSISRQKVNRMLKKAKEEGIVQISILDVNENSVLERTLEKIFGLREVRICSSESSKLDSEIGKLAVSVLLRRVTSNSVLGVSWGNTLSNMIEWCPPGDSNFQDVTVVQLNGGMTRSISPTGAGYLLDAIGRSFNAEVYQLPVPAIVDSPTVCQHLKTERVVRDVLTLASKSDIALFSIGIPDSNSVLSIAGYLSEDELTTLSMEKHAEGDICSRYFTHEGIVAWPEMDERTIGLTLEQLRLIPEKICVVFGKRKLHAVYTALLSKYVDVLVVDRELGQSIVELHNSEEEERI